MLPFFGAMIAAFMVITYIPASLLRQPVQIGRVKAGGVETCSLMDFEKPDPKNTK
ncbi:hypothetical protein [Novipirellula artificiosorum]|uniref:Uncharacterized protein n=1 Tax=Novipirellula artificiosorum TaxID=2528016 RepID=A0A5C6D3C9_9BACT|nr:hypothetical protein [Novipirellula artificiosorum]TWU31713.1 hypothetical protein Poly41_59470 [Novipirellula artificiosorum]